MGLNGLFCFAIKITLGRCVCARWRLSNAFHSFHLELIFHSNLFHHNEQFRVDRSDFTMLMWILIVLVRVPSLFLSFLLAFHLKPPFHTRAHAHKHSLSRLNSFLICMLRSFNMVFYLVGARPFSIEYTTKW